MSLNRFELPVNGIVHHLLDFNSIIPDEAELETLDQYLNTLHFPWITDEEWTNAKKEARTLYKNSFAWYSGCPAVALFVSSKQVVCGGIIESSAYNPTVNPLQV